MQHAYCASKKSHGNKDLSKRDFSANEGLDNISVLEDERI